jgi:hypothetical protein
MGILMFTRFHFFVLTCRIRDIIRREISPSLVQVGQIAQIKMQLRLLKQANGTFTLQELLKGVYVIDNKLSMVCPFHQINRLQSNDEVLKEIARDYVNRLLANERRVRREAKFYTIDRNKEQGPSMNATEGA